MRKEKYSMKFLNFMFGLLLGSVCGTVAASLLTPKSGEEIRNEIRGSLDEIRLEYETGKQKSREDLEADVRRRWGE